MICAVCLHELAGRLSLQVAERKAEAAITIANGQAVCLQHFVDGQESQ